LAVVGVVFCWACGVVCIPDRRQNPNEPKQPVGLNDDVVGNGERQKKKADIARDLFDGKLTLANAVELCLRLDDDYPPLAMVYRPFIDKLPGQNYAEKKPATCWYSPKTMCASTPTDWHHDAITSGAFRTVRESVAPKKLTGVKTWASQLQVPLHPPTSPERFQETRIRLLADQCLARRHD
jgi:hypothetical protein